MTKTRPQEETLFDAARNLGNPAARRAFLDQACADDPGLRAKVEALLAAEADAEKFFKAATPHKVPDDATQARSSEEGSRHAEFSFADGVSTRIGRYKLLQKIGEGGCGVVYMAEQDSPRGVNTGTTRLLHGGSPVRRRIALKIIKLGMDTKSVIARFEAERQALAMMDHPNIARVLDAGATDAGRPYFVMELVRGVKITDYCDQNNLDTRQRLDLFIQICQAIQHAHQKGIIHRDIKPSNILVTLHDGVPVPKVIDFGIAKATGARLTDKTLFTAYEQVIGTPAYMSPEQAEMSGLDIDTRSDIYSLGVLLYELLTGKTPFDPKKLLQHGLDEMRRTLREQEPQRPSTMVTTLQGTELTTMAEHRRAAPPKLISLLRGDLDWIVMKTLEKDRRRRYETANGLTMDIQRYLNNEPVVARPPSRLYRFQKLVRRNKVIFAAGAAVAVALIIGLGTSTWLFVMERAARQRAVAAEKQAESARANEAELRRLAETREKITQATVLVNQDEFEKADKLIKEVSVAEPTVEGAAVFRSVGEWHAFQNQWKEAADRFTELLKINHLDGWDVYTLDYLECGPALIELGDKDGYERFRQAALATWSKYWLPARSENGLHPGGHNPTPGTHAYSTGRARFTVAAHPFADRILKISLLLPANEKVMKDLEPLAEATASSFASEVNANGDIFLAAWRSVSLGLMEYRRGNYAKAAEWCERCLNYPEHIAPRSATARVILAMSDQQLGKTSLPCGVGGFASVGLCQLYFTGRARSELAQAREIIENKFKSQLERGTPMQGFWFDWVFARILLREATGLISPAEASSGKAEIGKVESRN